MGCQASITKTGFPKQSEYLNWSVDVCFHYDTSSLIKGKVIRDDIESPFVTLVSLEDGRTVLGTECQFSFKNAPNPENEIINLPKHLSLEACRFLDKLKLYQGHNNKYIDYLIKTLSRGC